MVLINFLNDVGTDAVAGFMAERYASADRYNLTTGVIARDYAEFIRGYDSLSFGAFGGVKVMKFLP